MHMRRQLPGTAKDPFRLSRNVPALLERLEGKILLHAPDVLVLSGDLLDVPASVINGNSPDERSLSDWLFDVRSDLNFIKEWLSAVGTPFVVVPGNNDDEKSFAEVFSGCRSPVDIAGLRFYCFWDRLSAEQQPIRDKVNAALFQEAISGDKHECAQVHVQHYMIHPPVFAKNKHYQYTTSVDLKKSIDRSGRVLAVLSGHYHPGTLVEGKILHSGAPAFCEKPFSYRVYDLDEQSPARVETCILDN
tara:strand:- start:1568 stop:2308 length:741 start_codon:yes stop_codon:yes gene_type:complete